jgi:hypothetical protein
MSILPEPPFFWEAAYTAPPQMKKTAALLPPKRRRMNRPRFSKKRDHSQSGHAKPLIVANTPEEEIATCETESATVVDPLTDRPDEMENGPVVVVDTVPLITYEMEDNMGISLGKMVTDWYRMEVGLPAVVSADNVVDWGGSIYSRIDIERHLEENKAFYRMDPGSAPPPRRLDTFFDDVPPCFCIF